MALVLTGAPALEPVSVAEAKAHLRVDGEAEDALIASLILTSRLHIEAALGLSLITQSWRMLIDRWPKGPALNIPMRPLQSIDEVRVLSASSAATTILPSAYDADLSSAQPRLLRTGAALPQPGKPVHGIEIDLTAGYGDAASDVPAPIRHALLILCTHWYENREPIEVGSPAAGIPSSVSDLLTPNRVAQL